MPEVIYTGGKIDDFRYSKFKEKVQEQTTAEKSVNTKRAVGDGFD
jgi:anti-anti-sigma regulatory factor